MKSHESHKIPESRTENVAVADPSPELEEKEKDRQEATTVFL